MKNKAYVVFILYNIGLFTLIGWSIWYLKTPIPIIGLLFTMKLKFE